uniref:Uncharacterized protein n=1 Tax=Arundo donax TaxID=35708 RepID=A0A0A9GDY8_ARUDO
MPRELKSTETSAQVSPKGARRSSPPSAAIPRASSSNASATAVSGVSIPRRAATTAAAASHSGSAGAGADEDHGICDLNPSILPCPLPLPRRSACSPRDPLTSGATEGRWWEDARARREDGRARPGI